MLSILFQSSINSHVKHIPSNTRKHNAETFFESKTLKICTLNILMKNYGTHFKCHMIENEQMKKQASLPLGRGQLPRGEE